MSKEVDFSTALLAMKAGHRMARHGWNGKGMFVQGTRVVIELHQPAMDMLIMHGTNGNLFPWTPTQSDLFSVDWVEA